MAPIMELGPMTRAFVLLRSCATISQLCNDKTDMSRRQGPVTGRRRGTQFSRSCPWQRTAADSSGTLV
jgi:hypothetical protein